MGLLQQEREEAGEALAHILQRRCTRGARASKQTGKGAEDMARRGGFVVVGQGGGASSGQCLVVVLGGGGSRGRRQ